MHFYPDDTEASIVAYGSGSLNQMMTGDSHGDSFGGLTGHHLTTESQKVRRETI